MDQHQPPADLVEAGAAALREANPAMDFQVLTTPLNLTKTVLESIPDGWAKTDDGWRKYAFVEWEDPDG